MCIELDMYDIIIIILLVIMIVLSIGCIKLSLDFDDQKVEIEKLKNKVHYLKRSNKHYKKKLSKFMNKKYKKF